MNINYPLLYLAYGANTHRDHMRHRCPTAVFVGTAELIDYQLVFRSVADVIVRKGAVVACAMWEIHAKDELALDRFEGFPNFYTKRYATIKYEGKERLAMFYVMARPRDDRHEPPQSYEQTLRSGYAQCKMGTAQIDAAIVDARTSLRRVRKYNGAWLREDELRARLRHAGRDDSAARLDNLSRVPSEYPDWFLNQYFDGREVL